ncbi:MAG: permease-like cell division protein FtsX [Bacteroidaceae bacterium]|jgi:cell division transport system permease protein|nr:permease-like cell division protein FtsX [Bacteroidaceae bacterium]
MSRRKKKASYTGYFSTQFLTSLVSTTFVLMLLGTIVLFVISAKKASKYLKENVVVNLYLNEGVDDSQLLRLQNELDESGFVKEQLYKSKDEAQREAKELLGTDPGEFVGYNPFMAEIELKIAENYTSKDSLEAIATRLKLKSEINDVAYHPDLVESMNKGINKFTIVLLVLAALFTFISFGLINNTVRLNIFARRFLINTMKLVGASWGFIRKPFLKQAFVMGILSSILACIALFFIVRWFYAFDTEVKQIIDNQTLAIVGGSVILFGLLITFVCTYISINRYLRMSSNDLYHI